MILGKLYYTEVKNRGIIWSKTVERYALQRSATMIRILAIGNSFSQNATELLQLFDNDLFVRNLYIGGCNLKTHADNVTKDEKAYDYQENGTKCRAEKISVKEALTSEKWDYVTVQQSSGDSGITEYYYPYLGDLLAYVRKYTDAEIVFHQTWAYETGSAHPQFVLYDNDRKKMYEGILKASRYVAERENLRMIRCGEAVEKAREYRVFDSEKGGMDITADGFHLAGYGKFLAAAMWLKFFTGKTPEFLNREELSEPFDVIKSVLRQF